MNRWNLTNNNWEAELTMSIFFYHDTIALVGQGLHIVEDLWSHSDTPHSAGLLWMSDKSNDEICEPVHNIHPSIPQYSPQMHMFLSD